MTKSVEWWVMRVAVLCVCVCVWFGAGCVERTIEVTSSPSGALVYLNDEEVGRTPLRVPFMYYGVYDVRLEAEGHKPLWTTGEAVAPWWEYPGPDLLAEAWPGAASVVRWHYELEPAPGVEEVDTDGLIDRAETMRRRVDEAD